MSGRKSALIKIFVSSALLGAGFLLKARSIISLLLCISAYGIVGYDVILDAFRNILHRELLDERFLMTAATLGALWIGEYPEAVLVMLLYQIGELFQDYAVDRSKDAIASLMNLCPDIVTIEKNGALLDVPAETVQPGQIMVVRPGQRVVLDGTVISGVSSMDTATLTGESLPRSVQAGDEALSGCVNLTSLLRIRADKPLNQSAVSKILELTRNAAEHKAPADRFITRFSKVYTPCVVFAAILLAVIPSLMAGMWRTWIRRALIFLVVSCPCALVISVPLSFFGGIGAASRKGILVKGGNYLEALAKTRVMVFDKTGTLTQGVFKVRGIYPIKTDGQRLLRLTAMAERFSDHPVSRFIREACPDEAEPTDVIRHEEMPGLGVRAEIRREGIVYAGNQKLMKTMGIACPDRDEPGTVVHMALNGEYLGFIVISDTVKPDAKQTIQDLKKLGISRTVMLTGDSLSSARDIAQTLDMDEYHAELMPDGKVEKIRELIRRRQFGEAVVFVGDGINDAPVLTQADIGIAMGAFGSDAAIEAADIVLMDDRMSSIPAAIAIARKTLRIVRENIVFALLVKASVLILGAFGYVDMGAAVFADVGVSVLTTLNAMRTLSPISR